MHALPPRLALTVSLLAIMAPPLLANDDCRDAISIPCGNTVSGDTTGATTDGVWPCALGGSEIWYRFVATEPFALLDLCGSSYDTAVMVIDACGGNVLGCNDDSCGLQSRLALSDLDVGHTYLIAVGGFLGATGPFTMTLTCGLPPCAAAQAGDVEENEGGDCGYDSFNGGCNSVPPVFSPIADGQSVHGTSGTNDAIGYRDTDWWMFDVPSPCTLAVWTVTAEFPVLIGFIAQPCPQTSFMAGTAVTAPACTEVSTVTTSLPPGQYVAFVAPVGFTGVPCGAEYRAVLTFVTGCPPPPPENDRCENARPIDCGEMISDGNWNATTDAAWPCAVAGNEIWYSFLATDSRALISLCRSEFDTAVMVLTGCGGQVLGCNDNSCGPQSELKVDGLIVGNQYLIAVGGAMGATGQVTLALSCGPEPPCGHAHLGDIEEGEPSGGCADVDSFNSGCASTPPSFSPITCGDRVHGVSGTFIRNGAQYRDADWWEFPVESRRRVTWTVNADFPALIAFYGTACPNPITIAMSSGPACDPLSIRADLPPGEYAAYVAPADSSGIACGAQYRGTLDCEEICTGDLNHDGVRDLSDLALLLSEFGSLGGVYAGDLDGDGDVDLEDLAELLAFFGSHC